MGAYGGVKSQGHTNRDHCLLNHSLPLLFSSPLPTKLPLSSFRSLLKRFAQWMHKNAVKSSMWMPSPLMHQLLVGTCFRCTSSIAQERMCADRAPAHQTLAKMEVPVRRYRTRLKATRAPVHRVGKGIAARRISMSVLEVSIICILLHVQYYVLECAHALKSLLPFIYVLMHIHTYICILNSTSVQCNTYMCVYTGIGSIIIYNVVRNLYLLK